MEVHFTKDKIYLMKGSFEIEKYFVKSAVIDELQKVADYYITIDMRNINKPFGVKVQIRGGGSEEVHNAYTTAAEALSAATRFADNIVLPNTLRDIIRDEFIASIF